MNIDRSNYYVVFLAKRPNTPLGHVSYATREAATAGLEIARDQLPASWLTQVQDEPCLTLVSDELH